VAYGGGDGGEAGHSSSISNRKYSWAAADKAPSGTITLNGTVEFTDSELGLAAIQEVSRIAPKETTGAPLFSSLGSL
jgi:hypothetical protein